MTERKVLHILDGFGLGGAETWLMATVKYLKAHPELNLKFDFLVTGGIPRLFDDQIKEQGSRIFYIKYSLKSLPAFRRKLRSVLIENRYDIIHNHEDFVSGWHFLFGMGYLPKVRIVHLHNPYNFVHNYVVNPVRWISFKMGRLLMAGLASKITGTSNAVMDEYGYDKWPYRLKRTKAAYCGFDTSKFIFNSHARAQLCKELNWDTGIKIALFVGRIGLQDVDTAENQKNPDFAFSIAKKLVSANEEWRFIFVGYKGQTGNRMEAEVRELGIADKIKFLDVRNDVPDIMSSAQVLVFPSLWEGLGMVAVEAQSCGLPVIMSDTIPKEAIICNELVVVKALEDGVIEWVGSIIEVADVQYNRSDYSSIVSNSRFSIRNSVNDLIRIYNNADVR